MAEIFLIYLPLIYDWQIFVMLNIFITGLLSGVLIRLFGCRATQIVGSVTIAVGFVACALAPSLELLFLAAAIVGRELI